MNVKLGDSQANLADIEAANEELRQIEMSNKNGIPRTRYVSINVNFLKFVE